MTSSEHNFHLTFAIITITTNLVSSVLNVILNGLLLHTHMQNRRSPSQILVGNLTVTDILTGLIVQPAYAVHIVLDINGIFNYPVFVFFNFTAYLVCGISLVTAGGMSIDRLAATIRPFSYKFYGKLKIYVAAVALIWLQGIAFVLMYTFDVIGKAFARMAFMLIVSFAVLSFILSYTVIIVSMQKRERRITQSGPCGMMSTQKRSTTQRNNITKSFALMIIALCVMYLPLFFVKIVLWRSRNSHCVALNALNRLSNTVTFLNSLLNPILYCYSNKNTKRQIKEIVAKCFAQPGRNRIRPANIEGATRENVLHVVTSLS